MGSKRSNQAARQPVKHALDASAPEPNRPGQSREQGWKRLLPYGLLVAMTVAAYVPVARAGFIWDDDDYPQRVGENLSDLHGLARIWTDPGSTRQYYPLVFSTYWVENALWGQNPMGYHLVNVLLHGLAVILLWRLLTALRVPGAIFAAALFAVHPVCVESVAWVTERKNTLSMVFYLLAMLTYLPLAGLTEQAGLTTSAPASRRRNGLRYAGALLLFFAALLSKTVTVTFPAAVLVLTWWKHGRLSRRDVLRLAPFFLLAIGGGTVTMLVEKYYVGAEGSDWTLNALERAMLAGQMVWFYVYKLLWPAELIFNYAHWDISWKVPWQYLPVAGVLAVLAGLWLLRKRLGRGPMAAALLFIGSLAPTLGFINVFYFRYSYVADHFAYLAMPAILALLAVGATKLMKRCPAYARLPLYGAGAAAMVLLAALTWRQACVYQDSETLWRRCLADNPQSWMACNNYGALLTSQGRLGEAYLMFDRCLSLRPNCAEAYNNRGNALFDEKRYAEAFAAFDKAAQLHVDPIYYQNQGIALQNMGQHVRAIQAYTKAIRLDPHSTVSYQGRGECYLRIDHQKEAIADFSVVLARQPNAFAIWSQRGRAHLDLHEVEQAMADCDRCVKIDSNFAMGYVNRGAVYHVLGQYDKAINDYNKAISLKHGMPEAYYNRAMTMQAIKDLPQAVADLSMVIQLDPSVPQPYRQRGRLYQLMNRNFDAIDDFTQAFNLNKTLPGVLLDRGNSYRLLGRHEEALADYSAAIAINPASPDNYNNRAASYYHLKKFDLAWQDVHACERLGGTIDPAFMQSLQQASGRKE